MSDLISRQKVLNIIDWVHYHHCFSPSEEWAFEFIKGLVDSCADEAKHGKWESDEFLYSTMQTRCSVCKTEYYVDDLLNVGEGAQEFLPQYCPHCGAYMGRSEDG